MMKAAGVEPNAADAAQPSAGERRDPGTTTIRRPKRLRKPTAAAGLQRLQRSRLRKHRSTPSTEDAGAEE